MRSKIEAATTWMENLAADNSHGYAWGGWGPQDYDCGHAIITAWEQAGVPVKSSGGASYTGDMRRAFLNCGFKDVTASINLKTGEGLRRGDVILNEAEHVVMYVGSGNIVHARSSEGNTIPGDQSGNEIRVQPYFVYPSGWNCVLRYPETISYDDEAGETDQDPEPTSGQLQADGICGPQTWETISDMIAEMPQLECVTDGRGKIIRMPSGWHVAMLQAFLNYCDPDADLDVDGDYGPLTAAAVKQFQRRH